MKPKPDPRDERTVEVLRGGATGKPVKTKMKIGDLRRELRKSSAETE